MVTRIATPIIIKIATKIAREELNKKTSFHAKKETATAQSSYEQRSYRGHANSGVGDITVNGSRGNSSGDIPALTSLLSILEDLNIVIDKSTI